MITLHNKIFRLNGDMLGVDDSKIGVFKQKVIGAVPNLRYSLQCEIFWLNGDTLTVFEQKSD